MIPKHQNWFIDQKWSDEELFFLEDHLKNAQPKKVVEVGVHRGFSSKVILDNISPKSELFSIDLGTDGTIGSLCPKKENWWLFLGNYSFQLMEQIGKGIDFVLFNGSNRFPGKILDFLMILPFLSSKSTIVVYDLNVHLLHPLPDKYNFCSRQLFSLLSGPRCFNEFGIYKSNVGAIQINKRQQDYISLLESLSYPWSDFRIFRVNKDLITYFKKFFPEDFVQFYDYISKFQMRQKNLGNREKKGRIPC